MRRVNAYQFYFLGLRLGILRLIQEGDPVLDWSVWCNDAKEYLAEFLGNRAFEFSISVADAGKELADCLASFGTPEGRRAGSVLPLREFGDTDLTVLKMYLEQFEALLADELDKRCPLYLVAKKGIFDTADLIDRAELMFTDEKLRALLPDQARDDFRQGGRCLAFEAPTAAGFHVLRAVEAVVKRYHEIAAKKPWSLTQRDWGRYIAELGKVGAPKRVIDLLIQIKDNYRNPLMHPEDNLDIHEAVSLLGLSQSAINAMLQEIAKL